MPRGVYPRKKKRTAAVKTVALIEDAELNSADYLVCADRISVIESNINDFVLENKVLASPNRVSEKVKVELAMKLLAEVYQELGQYL